MVERSTVVFGDDGLITLQPMVPTFTSEESQIVFTDDGLIAEITPLVDPSPVAAEVVDPEVIVDPISVDPLVPSEEEVKEDPTIG